MKRDYGRLSIVYVMCLGLFADVMFELDDGSVPAHKAILTARCDVMKAMFSGDFRESSAKVVSAFIRTKQEGKDRFEPNECRRISLSQYNFLV